MTTVEPIKDTTEIKKIERILSSQSNRNLLLFILGINSGLRISDILALNVGDVRRKEYIQLVEKKTGKTMEILSIYIRIIQKNKSKKQLLS